MKGRCPRPLDEPVIKKSTCGKTTPIRTSNTSLSPKKRTVRISYGQNPVKRDQNAQFIARVPCARYSVVPLCTVPLMVQACTFDRVTSLEAQAFPRSVYHYVPFYFVVPLICRISRITHLTIYETLYTIYFRLGSEKWWERCVLNQGSRFFLFT